MSLRSGARVEDALGAARPRGRRDRRRARPDQAAARGAARRRVHRAARARRRGRHGAGAARDPRHPVHRVGRARLRALDGQGAHQAPAGRGRDPHAGVLRVQRDGVPRARRRRGAAGDRGAARLPDRGQAVSAGLGARDQVRAHRRGRAGRARRRLLATTRRCCSSATWTGATWPSRSSTASRCPVVEAVPQGDEFYDFEARYEIGRTEFVCPAELPAGVTAQAQELALRTYRAARLPRLRARGPDARRRRRASTCSRPTRSPA